MSEARIRHVPYVIQRHGDKYIVLNRDYEPLGFPNALVRYENYPSRSSSRASARPPLRRFRTRAAPTATRSTSTTDGCIPTRSAANLTAYLKRLAVFSNLKFARE